MSKSNQETKESWLHVFCVKVDKKRIKFMYFYFDLGNVQIVLCLQDVTIFCESY